MYDLTLARVDYLYRQLKDTELEKELAVIYAILLWPSFSKKRFYHSKDTHFSRVNQFFKCKNVEDGILFSGKCSSPLLLGIDSSQQVPTQDVSLQTKISLLLYWLTKDLKGFEGESELSLFAPTLIEQYQFCRPMLREAFRISLRTVDYQALLNESIYENLHRGALVEDLSINSVGITRNYFS
jgi:hypothetical protein